MRPRASRPGGGADYIDGGDGAFERSGRPMWRTYEDNRGECAARTNGFWDRYDEQGGDGNDTLDLGSVPSGVLADLNLCRLGYFGTGALALVHGIENVQGTRFNDRLVGDGDANRLDAGPGRSWLSGEGGRDRLETRDGEIDAVKCGDVEDEYVMDGREGGSAAETRVAPAGAHLPNAVRGAAKGGQDRCSRVERFANSMFPALGAG